ncbi:MAG: SDR family oxidoreductase [Clostridia bacterium]|nr:SDR family oxidoreductase [Clostridia bacterium]
MTRAVLITGGSRGIGAASVRLFVSRGWNAAFTYLHSEAASRALEEELSAQRPCCCALRCDCADREAARRMYAQATDRFGRIDALVCSAGISSTELFQDASEAEIDHLFRVNVYGTFFAAQAVLPDMISRRQGTIVTVSSMWGIAGASCEVIYSSAKAAVIGFTRALAQETAPSGIRVNCVAPGATDTDMLSCYSHETLKELAAEVPLGRIGRPEEIAEAIYYLASSRSSYLTGQVLSPNGGLVI